MSVAREQHTATLLPDGHVLVVGRFHFDPNFNDSFSSADLYTPATVKWTATGSMNTARYGHNAVLLPSGQALVLDAVDQSSEGTFSLNSTELDDSASGKWTVNGNTFQSGSSGLSVTLLGTGKVLIAGGVVGVYPHAHITRAAEVYDPTTGTSAFTGSMNTAREGQTAALLSNGKILVAGGASTSSIGWLLMFLNSSELYTP